MFRKKQNGRMERNSLRCGKGGFTLVELCVTMALVAMLATMVVSFAVMMSDTVKDSKSEYAFLEDHAELKEALGKWVAENDLAGNCFSAEKGVLLLSDGETEKEVKFRSGKLLIDNASIGEFDTIDSISFEEYDGKLVKCTVTCEDASISSRSFVFSLRLANIGEGESVNE